MIPFHLHIRPILVLSTLLYFLFGSKNGIQSYKATIFCSFHSSPIQKQKN
jgi:hypothetical protein